MNTLTEPNGNEGDQPFIPDEHMQHALSVNQKSI